MSVLIVTSLGDIVVDLYTDRCPLTSKNFLKLCKIKYYNGCLFHTVQKDFTAQTGDPTGTGTGGDSVYKFLYGDQARFFNDEIHLDLKHSKTGTLAMASAGENLNASQFYFTLRDDLDYLDGKHTVFGEVAEGLETLSRINDAYMDEKGRPFKNIRIKHTYILDDPFDDPSQLTELIPDASPEGKPKAEVDDDVRLEDDWEPLDEKLDATELEELIRSKEAHSRAVVLESIGDIPDAEIKPPDNVLFVCKLNPVTEDGDLHTIFSRFGTVISADIIRDYKTGDSLCYAFIEFETNKACEEAYLKMDNALIDDRRIHVDFSQSVAKLWSQYRRRGQQTGKGSGCFKCGAVDHIAKDCTGSPTKQPKHPTYILKDNNTQHGGDNSRYELVFDENPSGSPKQEKRRQDHGPEDRSEKEKMSRRGSEDWKHGDYDKKDSDRRHRQSDKGRGYRDDERNHENRGSRSSGGRRDPYHYEERTDREKLRERREEGKKERDEKDQRKRNADSDSRERRDGREERDHRKRNADGDRHVDRRDVGGYRNRVTDDGFGDGRNGRSTENEERGDRRDHRKKKADEDRRDKRDTRAEPGYRKRSADGDGDGNEGRREERGHKRRSTESDDERDRRHRGDRR